MIEKAWQLSEFIKMWFSILPQHKTYEDAYEAIEDQFFKKYGRRRYKNYETFKAAKCRSMKIKQ